MICIFLAVHTRQERCNGAVTQIPTFQQASGQKFPIRSDEVGVCVMDQIKALFFLCRSGILDPGTMPFPEVVDGDG